MLERTFAITRDVHPASLVAIGRAGTKTHEDLLADTQRVVEALRSTSDGTQCVVLCEDRYLFAVSALAAWQVGLAVASPPNFEDATIGEFLLDSDVACVLTDSPRIGQSRKELRVQQLLEAPLTGAPRPLAPVSSSRLAAVLYTSGTTGAARRCNKTAGQLLGEAEDAARLFGFTVGETVLSTTPSHHIYGMLFGILVPLAGCSPFVREPYFHAEAVAAAVSKYGVTTLVSVPAHLSGLCDLSPDALAGLRRVFSSAAPLRPATRDLLVSRFSLDVLELLGSTETGGFAHRSTALHGADAPWIPLPNVKTRSNDDGLLELTSPYAPGDPDEWYTCMDRVELLPDGRFRHQGRSDGVVKVGGKRIALQHLEEEVLSIDGVADAAAIAVDVAGLRGTEIWLAVVAPGLDAGAIRAVLARRFDPVVLPRRYRFVESLPRRDNGKLARRDVEALFS